MIGCLSFEGLGSGTLGYYVGSKRYCIGSKLDDSVASVISCNLCNKLKNQ